MISNGERQFLNELEEKLRNVGDKLRSTLDVVDYKHTVSRLVFLEYVSDAFDISRQELEGQLE